jgi:hypothetical protein
MVLSTKTTDRPEATISGERTGAIVLRGHEEPVDPVREPTPITLTSGATTTGVNAALVGWVDLEMRLPRREPPSQPEGQSE